MSNLVSYALIQTLSEIKEALDISGGDHDAKLNGYINRATEIIEAYCSRRFISTSYSNQLYSGNGTRFMSLRNWPVTNLTSVEAMTGDYSSPNWQSLDSSLYTLKSEGGKDRGLIYLLGDDRTFPVYGGFRKGVNNYRVNYTAGYIAADLPHDVREACIELVSWMFARRKATPGIKSETLGKYSYTLESPQSGRYGLIQQLGLDILLAPYRDIIV